MTKPTAKLPPKDPGEHRWIAIATYTVTAGQAAAASAGSQVKLGPHNLISLGIGCVDCEVEWPAPARCTAGAAPEMENVTDAGVWPATLPDEDKDRLLAAVDVIGRTGATGFEVGHLEDDVPVHLARWYAHATYQGARQMSEEHANPVDAAEGLAWLLLEGGGCRHCGRVIAMEGHAGPTLGRCIWHRKGPKWVAGCDES